MNTEDIPARAPQPWLPITDPLTLAIVGKLGEEASELAARCARIVIQGAFAVDPDSKRLNVRHLADEMADVFTCMELATSHFALPEEPFDERVERKTAFLEAWHAMLTPAQS